MIVQCDRLPDHNAHMDISLSCGPAHECVVDKLRLKKLGMPFASCVQSSREIHQEDTDPPSKLCGFGLSVRRDLYNVVFGIPLGGCEGSITCQNRKVAAYLCVIMDSWNVGGDWTLYADNTVIE